MKIWLCIPVFNRIEYTLKCLASLESQTYRNFAVVICDHGSSDGTSEAIKQQFPSTILLTGDSSMWWTAAINLCVRYALDHAGDSDFILTLNNDTELPSDYLQQLISCESKYPGNIVTSVIHDITDGKLVDIGYRQNWWLATGKSVNFADHHLPNDGDVIEISHASGRGTLFPIIVFRRIG
jgi:GT2 family glycosyltransferase